MSDQDEAPDTTEVKEVPIPKKKKKTKPAKKTKATNEALDVLKAEDEPAPTPDAKSKPKKKKKKNKSKVKAPPKTKVLMMHGLESGPRGHKVRVLQEDYEVFCPDMRPLIQQARSVSSPYIATLVALILFILGSFAYFVYYAFFYGNWGVLVMCIILAAVGVVMMRFLVQSGLNALRDDCIELQAKAIANFRPDIVIGSSYGGGIAVHCLMKKLWAGPTILLAPAHAQIDRKLMFIPQKKHYSLPSNVPVIIVHGENDKIVPMADSQALAGTSNPGFVQFITVDDEHPLNNFMTREKFVELITSMLKGPGAHDEAAKEKE